MKRLFFDLEDLEHAGGITAAAEQESWSAGKMGKAAGVIELIRQKLGAEVRRAREGRGGG